MFYEQASNQASCPKEKKHRVRFSEFSTFTLVTPCSTMSEHQKKDVWYDSDELELFRENARIDAKVASSSAPYCQGGTSTYGGGIGGDLYRLCLSSNPNNLDFSQLHMDSIKTCSPETMDFRAQIRGLEYRVNNERQRNRQITRCAILEAQRRLRKKAAQRNILCSDNPDAFAASLARVSCKFSKWAREIARQAGINDAYVANQPPSAAFCIETFIEVGSEPYETTKPGQNKRRKTEIEPANVPMTESNEALDCVDQ